MSQQSHLQAPSPKPRYQIAMPRLSASQMLAILRESGVPEQEARRWIDDDPTVVVDTAAGH